MRWFCALLLVLAGCTSAWERHQSRLAEHEAHGDHKRAVAEQRWLVDNSFREAPSVERSPAAQAARYVRLAKLASQAGKPRTAIEALREALTIDADQATAVRVQLERLPLGAQELERVKQEFAWNIAALAPSADAFLQGTSPPSQCWSYRVRELRIRRRRTISTPAGMEQQVTYDARPWRFDAASGQWQAESAWINDAGTETELANGPQRPRYRAVTAADHQFYLEEPAPPCHRPAWHGPFDADRPVFVADKLPASPSAHPQ